MQATYRGVYVPFGKETRSPMETGRKKELQRHVLVYSSKHSARLTLLGMLTLAPFFNSNLTISVCPFCAASEIGVVLSYRNASHQTSQKHNK